MKLDFDFTNNQIDLLKYSLILLKTGFYEKINSSKYYLETSKHNKEIESLNNYIAYLESEIKDITIVCDYLKSIST